LGLIISRQVLRFLASCLEIHPIFLYIVCCHSSEDTVQGIGIMRSGIHPEYKKATVSCVCGNTFETRTTAGNLKIEICSACHPFFTGRQKLVDSAGRVERYNKKYAKKSADTTGS
jgi:large subunit ribosomal protein L31